MTRASRDYPCRHRMLVVVRRDPRRGHAASARDTPASVGAQGNHQRRLRIPPAGRVDWPVVGATLRARVVELWRYPVKSLQGERLAAVNVEADGLEGDRRWGIRDEATGRVLTGRREPRLLEAAARLGEANEPLIVLPGGSVLDGPGQATDAAFS